MSLNHLVLALNAAYEPVNIISARRALSLVLGMGPDGVKAVVEKPSKHFIRVGAVPFAIPSVIRFLKYRRTPRMNRSVSRKSILLRDRLKCQYCLRGFPARELTLDHVIPRSRSGPSSWENLVSACYDCNNKKGDRTPIEAGMMLARKPAAIGIHAKHRLMIGTAVSDWDEYMYV